MSPTSPVRLGIQVQPQHAQYTAIRDTVLRLEELGADIVFNWDHFFPLSGDREGLHFEAWTMLGAWAEQTERLEFGTLVNCNSYRNADLQADMARTLDHISAKDGGAGRFIFGTGSGWFERDYDEYGYEFGTVGRRLNALARDLPIIEDRWGKLNPAPTRDIPILIGGGGEKKTLRLVAQYGDIWHSFSDSSEYPRKAEILDSHCRDVGRDPAEIERSIGVQKPPEHVGDALLAAGATLFTVGFGGPHHDMGLLKEWIAWR